MWEINDPKGEKDRDHLFGTVALQLNFITQEQLASAVEVRAGDPSQKLSQVLIKQGVLTPEQVKVVEEALRLQIQKNQVKAKAPLPDLDDDALKSLAPPAPKKKEKLPPLEPPGGKAALESFGGFSVEEKAGPTVGERLDQATDVTLEHPKRYTIKSEKGRGGIGRVLLAFDEHIGRDVALKELLPESGGSLSSGATPTRITARALARFLQEARITGQLEHPAIIPVYEVGRRPDGSIYYTMRLVKGQDMSERIAACHSLSERLALLPHFLDLVQAMAYAHSRGVIHRDIKPHNVMVGEFGETVVLDWGLAKVKGVADDRAGELEEGLRLIKDAKAGETISGKPIGTPSYMPPEQADGLIDEIDERSDIYSLGAVLYEILTGEPPFSGGAAYEVLGMVLSSKLEPVKKLEPGAPPELAAIAEKCLHKDRSQRYPSAREVAEDVIKFQSGGLVSAYEYSMAALATRWIRKHWPIFTTAVVALIALVTLGVLSYVRISAEKEEADRQRDRAEELRGRAELEKTRAVASLAEAYYQYGLRSEQDTLLDQALLYFLQALSFADREEFRDAAYRLLTHPLRASPLRTLKGHQHPVTALAFSPDGRRLISASCANLKDEVCVQGEMRLWSVDSGELEKIFIGNRYRIGALAFSADGREFYSGSCGELSRIGQCVQGEVKRWSIKKGEYVEILPGHKSDVQAMALSPDGAYLVSAGCGQEAGYGCFEGELIVWSTGDGTKTLALSAHQENIRAIAFSPDGKRLVSAGNDKKLVVWSTETWQAEKEFIGHQAPVSAAAFSPDGKRIISGSCAQTGPAGCIRGEIRIWSLAGDKAPVTLSAHQGEVSSLAISPDGEWLVSAGCHQKDVSGTCRIGEMKIWSLKEGKCVHTFVAHPGGILAVAFSPEGDVIASAGADHEVRLWSLYNLKGVRVLAGYKKRLNSAAFSPDGKTLVTACSNGDLKFWEAESAKLIRTVNKDLGDFQGVAFSPDGSLVIAGGQDGEIEFYSAAGEPVRTIEAHQALVKTVAIARSEDLLLSASADKTLKLWSLKQGKELKSIPAHDNPITAAAMSPDGKFAASASFSVDRKTQPPTMKPELKLFDLASGQSQWTWSEGEPLILALAFSRDGKIVAAASDDKKVRLFSADDGSPVKTLSGHQDAVGAVVFFPESGLLASGSKDGEIKLWEVSTGKCVLTVAAHHDDVSALAVSGDGTRLVSTSWDRTAMIWPMVPELLSGGAETLLHKLERETGLILEGFEVKTGFAVVSTEQTEGP